MLYMLVVMTPESQCVGFDKTNNCCRAADESCVDGFVTSKVYCHCIQ